MLDDSQTRQRRNVMLISSAVIIAWLLEIPMEGKIIGITDLEKIAPEKIWALFLILTAYFLYRYHLSVGTQTEMGEAIAKWEKYKLITSKKLLLHFLITTSAPPPMLYKQKYTIIPNNPIKRDYSKIDLATFMEKYDKYNKLEEQVSGGKRSTLTYFEPSGEYRYEAEIVTTRRSNIVVFILCSYSIFKNEWESSEFFLPYILASVAMIVAAVKSFNHAFPDYFRENLYYAMIL